MTRGRRRPVWIRIAPWLLAIWALGACTGSAPASGTTAPATPTAVVLPAPTATPLPSPSPVGTPPADTFLLPANCYREGLPTYLSRAQGICFAYPQHFALGEPATGQADIVGPALDASPDPLRATLTLQVRPAAARSLSDLVASYALETGTAPETRPSDVTLDGEPGKLLEPVMGRPNTRSVLLVHAGQLYVLSFAPSLKDSLPAQQSGVWTTGERDMRALFEIATDSFAFLDTPRQVGTDSVLGVAPSCIRAGHALLVDAAGGYCLAIPPRCNVDEFNPGQRAVYGPALDLGPDPLRASLLVEVKSVESGRSLPSLADEFVRANPGSVLERSDLLLGGRPAVSVSGVPARMTSWNVFSLYGARLYTLWLQPAALPKAAADFELLKAATVQTFGFLPEPNAGPGPMPALSQVSWQTAQEMILRGQVTRVSQSHSLEVLLTLRDGRVVRSVEPQIDDVLRVIRQCGPACAGVAVATE